MSFPIRDHLKTFQLVSYVPIPDCIRAIPAEALLDCSYGTNPFGFSRKVADFFANLSGEQAAHYVNNYPDPAYTELCQTIIHYYKSIVTLTPENIRFAAGSISLLALLSKLFMDKGRHVLGFCPQFTDFTTNIQMNGGIYDSVPLRPENNYRFDVSEYLQHLTAEHTLAYIDNPSNPTGQVISLSDIEAVCQAAKALGVAVVLDEAYGDFVGLAASAAVLLPKYDNLIVLRSFSKGFGLAAMRCGYVLSSPAFFQEFDKIALPFPVTALAAKAAVLSLQDDGFLPTSVGKIQAAKSLLRKSLPQMQVWETDNRVPIMTLQHPNPTVDLFTLLASYGVFSEPSYGFFQMPKSAVRLRVPENTAALIAILQIIQAET